MFTPILLSVAMAESGHSGEMIVVDDRPTIRLDVGKYDLRKADDLKRVESRVHWAADRVCVRGFGLFAERVACVKGAILDADAQLNAMLARIPSTTPLTTTIAVTTQAK